MRIATLLINKYTNQINLCYTVTHLQETGFPKTKDSMKAYKHKHKKTKQNKTSQVKQNESKVLRLLILDMCNLMMKNNMKLNTKLLRRPKCKKELVKKIWLIF